MGFFDRIFGRRSAGIDDPEQLRRQLFDAAARGDLSRLAGLCRANRQAVETHFPAWQKVPEHLRSDPAAMQSHVQVLVAIAQVFAQQLGDASLFQRLMGTPRDNPLMRWQDALRQAQERIDALEFTAARELLTGVLSEAEGLQGSGVDELLPITLGRIGECHFESGEAEQALPYMQQALALCEQAGDADGVRIYLGNLFEVHRWLEQREPAAACARRLAEMIADPTAKRQRLRQAERVAAGEPRNRVLAVIDGASYELDELPPLAAGHVRFMFERDRITLRRATAANEAGEACGGEGEYAEALAHFERAATADRHDPHCRYQAAFTLLHLRRYAEAESAYAEVERLAPGWFHCRADRWLAGRLAAGDVEHDVFLAVHALQDGPMAPDEKLDLAEKTLTRAPRLALLHLLRGTQLARLGREAEAVAAFRDGLAGDGEPDVRSRLLVELATHCDGPQERAALLRDAQAPAGNLVAAATAQLLARGSAN
ncbi:tetratricopeptide repeat protein [Nannocystis radixulma]|uniref:Tetratricopeptide repeat protein n=1 Tax=Nannocystis radixulma TaxID=2995305 RepID=A0ABT5B4B9_9BACT|nr:tetratricopeptide repeat protein [Nannocystis radixulma]MDC0668369.1 tetratricopeptide repeat protein [Nannocystis radixulma]